MNWEPRQILFLFVFSQFFFIILIKTNMKNSKHIREKKILRLIKFYNFYPLIFILTLFYSVISNNILANKIIKNLFTFSYRLKFLNTFLIPS